MVEDNWNLTKGHHSDRVSKLTMTIGTPHSTEIHLVLHNSHYCQIGAICYINVILYPGNKYGIFRVTGQGYTALRRDRVVSIVSLRLHLTC